MVAETAGVTYWLLASLAYLHTASLLHNVPILCLSWRLTDC